MVGIGYDLHKLSEGESFILGGVKIDSSFGTIAHSDGDVLIHSIIDAILGAMGMGDIGDYFPDTSDNYKDINSVDLLKEVLLWAEEKKYQIVNIDATLVLEKPKLAPYKLTIRENLSMILDIPLERVNVKATTNEKMGHIGRSESIVCLSICELLERK